MSVSDSYVKEKRMQAYDGVGELISYLKFTYFGSTEGMGNLPRKELAEEVVKRVNLLITSVIWYTPGLEQSLYKTFELYTRVINSDGLPHEIIGPFPNALYLKLSLQYFKDVVELDDVQGFVQPIIAGLQQGYDFHRDAGHID